MRRLMGKRAGGGAGALPDIDERLVMPGSRYEILDGELLYVSPADEPHGETHSRLCALLEAHAAKRFRCAADMLTRTSATSDFAPDASVFPSGVGVNPIETILAVSKHAARRILARA